MTDDKIEAWKMAGRGSGRAESIAVPIAKRLGRSLALPFSTRSRRYSSRVSF